MKLHAHHRTGDTDVASRSRGARIAVALLATAALCLGPAVAASADDAPAAEVATEAAVSAAAADQPAVSDTVSGASEDAPAPPEETTESAPPEPAAEAAPPAEDAGTEGTEATEEASTDGDASEEEAGEATEAEVDPEATAPEDDASALATPEAATLGDRGHQGITICHATSSDSNPYVMQTVDVDSIFGQNGHSQHTKANGTRSDVIPAFWYVKNGNKHQYSYPGNGNYYPGKGLDATGTYMLGHDCKQPPKPPECPTDVMAAAAFGGHGYPPECPKPPECPIVSEQSGATLASDEGPSWNAGGKKWECPKEPEIEVIPGDCLVVDGDWEGEYSESAGESVAQIIGSNLKPGGHYKVVVWFDGSEVYSDTFTADGEGMIVAWPGLTEAGSYVATITSLGHKPRSASAEFEVAECPPVVVPHVAVAVATCVAGDPAQALQVLVTAADLEPGETYSLMVTGPDGFAWDGSVMGSEAGTAEATVILGPDGTYAASLEGAPTVEFAAVKTCTPTVVVPSGGPALPSTGSSEAQPLIWAAVLAMIVAAGLMLEPVLTRRTRR